MKGTLSNNMVLPANIPDSLRAELTRLLTVDNPQFQTAMRFSPWGTANAVEEKLCFYGTDEDDNFCIPRGFNPHTLSPLNRKLFLRVKFSDKRISVPAEFPKPLLTPNAEQQVLLESLESSVAAKARPAGNFLFLASTSVGKTILQALAAKFLGQRTLVLCPTDLSILGWQADLKKLFGSKFKIGLIKQSTFRVEDCITIGSAKTLMRRREHWDDINKLFGCIVIDEAHNLTADYLLSFVRQSPAKFLVGATATESSSEDSINHHLRFILGEAIGRQDAYKAETATSLPIKQAKLVGTEFDYKHDRLTLDWHDFALAMSCDENRNEVVVSEVLADLNKGRVCLVATKTLEHVTVLTNLFRERGIRKLGVITGSTNANRKKTVRLLSAIKNGRVTCVVSTIQAIKEAANIPRLDTLHVVMPMAKTGNLEQLIGRIRRKADGKRNAKVRYYLDKRMAYCMGLYKRIVVPVFRKMKIPGYENLFIA